MAQRLTDRNVKALPAPASGNRITYDSEVSGFGARITAAGAIGFVLNYRRKADGLERRTTIGTFPAWSVVAARRRAAELRRAVDSGADPVGELAAERGAPTVATLCERFEIEHLPKLRPTTRRIYSAMIKAELLPALGAMKVGAVEYAHIDRLHAKITGRGHPYMANRVVTLLSKLFALAKLWGMRKDSPVQGVERNQEHRRRRYLLADELARLRKALDGYRNREAADVFSLLLLTGARKTEVLSATWDQIDLADGIWTKPGSATKQKTEHRVPLSAPARHLLERRFHNRDAATPFVFPGPGPRQHRNNIRRDWERICKAAEITGLRIHDLRHSYASQLASAGVGLHIIGGLLGHSQPSTTFRYAHLFDDPLRAATERAGDLIVGRPAAKVIRLKNNLESCNLRAVSISVASGRRRSAADEK
jgi:integrase